MKTSYYYLLTVLIFFGLFSNAACLGQEKYSRIRIFTGPDGIKKLAGAGLAMDHGFSKRDTWFVGEFSESEQKRISGLGFRFTVLIDDVVKNLHQANNSKSGASVGAVLGNGCINTSKIPVPANFHLGSMGGYFTYQQILDNLDSMQKKYPNLISLRQQIDTFNSIEGRPIYWLRLSDNPTIQENEPEGLYTALHHAREPGSISQMIFFMWHLLENYNTNPEIKLLVNNTQLYFIPIVNPDGYLYNQRIQPNGGGMWRKNRRRNADGTYGVDLNRNYGMNWGLDNVGSSGTTSDLTYRGTAPFSEPETRAVKYLAEHHQFKICLNYHTFGNDLIYPWGYTLGLQTPDSSTFFNTGTLMCRDNHYRYGTGDQTVGYVTNGDSDDWGYGEQQTKNKIYSMTPEIGESFYDPRNTIIPTCQSNLHPNLTMARFLLHIARIQEISPRLLPANTQYLKFKLRCISDTIIPTVTVRLNAVGHTGSSSKVYTSLQPNQVITDSLPINLTISGAGPDTIKFDFSTDNGLIVTHDTITKIFGNVNDIFYSNCDTLKGWNMGNWGFSNTVFASPHRSVTDSPVGPYDNNSTNELYTDTIFDVSDAQSLSLRFKGRWDIEQLYDHVRISVTTDLGGTWVPVCGKFTRIGANTFGSTQTYGSPVYDGTMVEWADEEMNLDEFAGQATLQLKVTLASDQATTRDGFYWDEIHLTGLFKSPITGLINNTKSSLRIYPNPASDLLKISTKDVDNTQGMLEITDLAGRAVLSLKLNNDAQQSELDISQLSNGLYVCRYLSNGICLGREKITVAR